MEERPIKDQIIDSLSRPIREALEDEGIDSFRLAKKLRDKLDAKITKHFAHEGVVMDDRDYEAHDIQLRALDMALKLRGDYPAERRQVTFPEGIPVRNFSPEEETLYEKIKEDAKANLKSGSK